ncbi:hypothetical protein HNQ41_003370 [Texcoconibacillus texcoconensis]|uniref:Uncharacterized protein n=1 Tax=Texcoconibacillus texcoconensis TaxID=1095777 RepID=A0A840QUW1_9BACI|nr:hypothetical protein [Texcoconibacillus texcoconensis]
MLSGLPVEVKVEVELQQNYDSFVSVKRVFVIFGETRLLGKHSEVQGRIERPSKVATYSGWDSRRVRASHSLVASLGG